MKKQTLRADRNKKRGFSLVESAIVLGVVGLIVGGIWTAAATVNENRKWQQTEEGWLYYIDYIGKTYTRANTKGITGNTDIQVMLQKSIPMPPGWTCCGQYGSPVDPFGNQLMAQLQGGGTFSLSYFGTTSPSFCRKWMMMTFNKILGVGKLLNAYYYSSVGSPGACPATAVTWGSYNPPEGAKVTIADVEACCPNTQMGFNAYYPLAE